MLLFELWVLNVGAELLNAIHVATLKLRLGQQVRHQSEVGMTSTHKRGCDRRMVRNLFGETLKLRRDQLISLT